MTDLTEFLLARIAEDEAVGAHEWQYVGLASDEGFVQYDNTRVLAECDAKRRIVALADWTGPKEGLRDRLFGPAADEAFQQGIKAALRLLALPYADHPHYDPAWRQ